MDTHDEAESLPVQPWDGEFPERYPDELYMAIGRVAAASARLDEMLTELVAYLAGTDVMWQITTGQNTDWLLQTCRGLLGEVDPFYRQFSEEQHKRMLDYFDEAGALRHLRNRVVHGLWHTQPFLEVGTLRRPWGRGAAEESALFVSRQRTRRGFDEQEMTVGDVEQLAARLDSLRDDIVVHWRTMDADHDVKYPPFARWARGL